MCDDQDQYDSDQTYLSILTILQGSVYVDRNKCKHFKIITDFFLILRILPPKNFYVYLKATDWVAKREHTVIGIAGRCT